jgi:hypothetical protein
MFSLISLPVPSQQITMFFLADQALRERASVCDGGSPNCRR